MTLRSIGARIGIKSNRIIAKRRSLPSKKNCSSVNRPSGGSTKQLAASRLFTGLGYNMRRSDMV